MMHADACAVCGHDPHPAADVRLYDERGDAEGRSIDEQMAGAPRELRDLLRLLKARLKAEDRATDRFESGLRATFARVVETLQRAAERPNRPETVAILNANVEQLGQLLDAAGVGDARAQLRDDLRPIVDAANKSAEVVGLPPGIVALDMPALRVVLQQADDTFWRGKITLPAASLIREGLDRALRLEPLAKTVETIARQLDTSVARAVSLARTEVAEFDRRVNVEVALRGNLRRWVYLGPLDGLTRPFCRSLVGLVVDAEQMQELDNRQRPSPLVSGGGWGCRHRWCAVTDFLVDKRGMQIASAADIDAANTGASRGRR